MTDSGITIVVGYTPSRFGDAAVRVAIEEARLRGGRLHVVNVSRGDAWVDPNLAEQGELTTLDEQLAECGVEHEVVQLVGGEPAAEVLRAVKETGAGLVVIGLRRRTAVGKFLLGSTAQTILLDAPCPVLAVKPSVDS